MFSLYTVITAKCKVFWPLPPQSVFVFFFSRRHFAFTIVHTSSSLSLQVQSVLTCTSPIHYKANRGGESPHMNTKAAIPWCYTRFRLQYIPQSISKYLHYFHMHCKVGFLTKGTRTKCSRKVRDIESGSCQRWLGWRGWWMVICKRPVPLDDHLQEAGPSGW